MIEIIHRPNDFEAGKVPENNLMERFQRLYRLLRLVTYKSKIRGRSKTRNKERSLLNRRDRREALIEAKLNRRRRQEILVESKLDKKGRREAIKKASKAEKSDTYDSNHAEELAKNFRAIKKLLENSRARDEIADQYLNQSGVTVENDFSRYTVLSPPESRRNEAYKSLPPIVLIPGISNDIDPVGALAQELAFRGRDVVVIGYPESTMGKVSKDFFDEMQKTDGFEAHAEFFKEAISKILGPEQEIDIWSHSTGGPISAEILSNKEFSQRVKNAIIIAPTASVDQSLTKLKMGILKEVRADLKAIPDFAKYSLVPPGKDQDKNQEKLKDKVFSLLRERTLVQSKKWETMKVKEGGKIIIWSGEKDSVTKSAQAHELFEENIQVQSIINQGGSHLIDLAKPEKVIEAVHKILLPRE